MQFSFVKITVKLNITELRLHLDTINDDQNKTHKY